MGADALRAALEACPIIAILRYIEPHEAEAVGGALVDAGVRVIEAPLNSPRPFETIEILARAFGDQAIVGAGTVLSPEEVGQVRDAGGRIVVSPNFHEPVVRATVAADMISTPGVFTPSEAFDALRAGATALKIFPGDAISPKVVKALRAVLPTDAMVAVTGGVDAGNAAGFLAVGCDGVGIGSALYKPGRSAADVGAAAKSFVSAIREGAA